MADYIEIEAPDGSIVEFPAGMPEEEIRAVMAKAYPPAPVTPPQQAQTAPQAPLGAFNEGLAAEYMAAVQGTSPVTRTLAGEANYPVVGELLTAETELGPANTVVQAGPDQFVDFNPQTHVVFPEGGRMVVYERTPEMEEGAITRGARMVGLGALAPAFATAPARAMRGLTPPSQLERTARQFQQAGIEPRLPAITDAPGVRMTAQGIGGVPMGGGPIKAGVDRTVGEYIDGLGRAALQYGTAQESREGGTAVIRGAQQWFDEWRDAGRAMDRALEPRFGSQPIELNAFYDALNAPLRQWNDPRLAEMFGNERLDQWRRVIADTEGAVSYNDLLNLRREIGDELAKPAIINDIDQSQLRRFYGALSQDLRDAARNIDPALERDVIRRNNYWSEGFDRIDTALKEPLRPDATPERVFERIMQIGKEKGKSANTKELARLRRSMPAERWGDLASSVIARMATAPAGQQAAGGRFSPTTFLTNWNAMSPQAKNILFSGNPDGRRALDRLANVIGPQLNRLREYENVSRTGNVQGMIALGGAGIFAGLPTALSAAIGANATGRVLMNPRFTTWLARTATRAKAAQRKMARLPEDARQAFTQRFWAQNLGRLRALVEKDESLEPVLAELESQ